MTLVHDHTHLDADLNADLDREASMVARAAACAPTLARNAAQHDQDGSWVQESFAEVRRAGLLRVAVPTELGGDGATLREVAMVQRELAKSCGSTALASAMHQHVTAFTAWRFRRGLPGTEATLRRIAEEGIIVASTGGGDYTEPNGVAEKVEGGAFRDVRAVRFHPFDPETTLVHAGRHALGLPCDQPRTWATS